MQVKKDFLGKIKHDNMICMQISKWSTLSKNKVTAYIHDYWLHGDKKKHILNKNLSHNKVH